MPRVAGLLDVMQISDISEVKSATLSCADLCRQCRADRAVGEAKKIVTVRTASLRRRPKPAQHPLRNKCRMIPPSLYQSENLSKSDRPSSPPPR